jgi:DNA-binding transcriptional ArsR family regulator
MTADTHPELLTFFKALADENRLKIVGLLARESFSGEQLAAILRLKPATISHHLGKLSEAGLVNTVQEGHSKLFTLRLDAVHQMAERLIQKDTLPRTAEDVDVEAFDRKVVRDFSRRDGSLKEIPASQKKLQAILRHLLKEFEDSRHYTEKQVNDIISRFHPDTASLRRAMIEYKYMARAGGKYWKT